MANQDLKAKLVIDAQTQGQAEVNALVAGLEELAQQGGEAAPKFAELAQSMRTLADQDRLIADFAQLKREAQDTGDAMDAATTQVDRLATELEQASQAAKDAAAAQASAAKQLDAARAYQTQLRDAMAQTRAELKLSRDAMAQGGDDAALFAERVRDGAAQLKVLRAEEQAAAEGVRLLSAAYKESSAASRNAVNDHKQMALEYERVVQNAGQLSGSLAQTRQALQASRDALQAAGIDTKGLSDQQLALKNRLMESLKQAQQYTQVMHEMRGEAQALAPAMEATFKQLGMRGVQQITAEIERLQAAMRGLKGQNILPQDASRATVELQKRIEALRKEMGSAQGAAKGTANAMQSLGASSERASSQIGAVAHKAVAWTGAMVGLGEIKRVAAAVLETGSSFEQLERRLTSILGSTSKAQEAFAMIKDLAQATPFDVQGLTEAYTKLSAFGLQPTRQQMLAMADVAASVGGGTEALTGVSLALGQAWTKNKLQGEEILQLAERGIPVWDLLAKATGKSVEQLQKMSEAGQLGRDTILQLIDAMGKKNAGASADLMNSYAGAVQRAQDALQEFFNMIAQSGVLEYLTTQLQGLLAKFDELKASGELDKWSKDIADGFIQVANAAQGVIAGVQLLAPAFESLLKVWAVSKVMNFVGSLGLLRGAAKVVGDEMERVTLKSSLFGAASQASAALIAAWALKVGEAWLKIAKDYGAYQAELKKHDALNAQVQQKQQQVAEKLKAVSDATGVAVTSMEELNAAQAAGTIVFDETTAKWLSAAQAQDKLAGAVKLTTRELAEQDASTMVAEFEKIATSSDKTGEAIAKLAQGLKFDDVKGVGAFSLAMDALAAKGKISAQQVGDAWQQALGKLTVGNIGALRANLEEAARQGIITAQQWAQANEQVLVASFDKLGVNAAQALGKISPAAQEAIGSVDLVAESAKAAGVGAESAARAIEMAFAAAIPKADSLEAIDALEKQLKSMGEAGKISAEGVERTQAALDKQRAAIEGQIPGVQSLEEALRNLGVKPQKELAALAASAKQAFDVVKASGTATPREINEAWKAMAEATIEANNGVADASLKAQAQQYGMVVETDKAGKSIVKSMKEAEEATKDVGKAAEATAETIAELSEAGWAATNDMVAQARAHNAALAKVETSWLDSTAAASKYAQEMAAVVWSANKSIEAMTQEHARLVEQMEAMAEQQKQLEDQGNGAARGVEDLRLRLLELSGTEEEIARARQEREVAEVQRKMALMQLDLQRAEISGKTQEAQRLQTELALLEEQLVLLDKIFRKEEQQRKAREREERSGGGGSGGGSGGGGAGGSGKGLSAPPAPSAPAGPINITLNANGINDPVRLARMIEPELAKLGRLAR